MWRVAGDIQGGWFNVMRNIDGTADILGLEAFSDRGGWDDLDILKIGAQPGNNSWVPPPFPCEI